MEYGNNIGSYRIGMKETEEYLEEQRKIDLDKSDFPYIQLSREEIQIIKRMDKEDPATPFIITPFNPWHKWGYNLSQLHLVRITPNEDKTQTWTLRFRGSEYLRFWKYLSARTRSNTRRYWITTAIAVLAMLKAFLPEILAAAAALSKALGLQ